MVKKNHSYIVTDVCRNAVTGDTFFKLLDMNPGPFKGYRSDRFGIIQGFSVN
jgi:hypothetical protein